jgi:hypothetical protein
MSSLCFILKRNQTGGFKLQSGDELTKLDPPWIQSLEIIGGVHSCGMIGICKVIDSDPFNIMPTSSNSSILICFLLAMQMALIPHVRMKITPSCYGHLFFLHIRQRKFPCNPNLVFNNVDLRKNSTYKL